MFEYIQPCVCTQVPAPAFLHEGSVSPYFPWIGILSAFRALMRFPVWLCLVYILLQNVFQIGTLKFDSTAPANM